MSLLQGKAKELLRQKVNAWRHRHIDNFVFIHINKTAGSSITKALQIPFEHKTAMEKISELGPSRWEKRHTFAVVRNPWDKVVSHYHYRVQTNQTNLGDSPLPFKDWVLRTYGAQDPSYYNNPKMFMPQLEWISDEAGNVLVDDTLRFEHLSSEFNALMSKLGMQAELPHVKSSKRGRYAEYYDDETRAVVGRWFEKDIAYFEYDF